jgi:hypothetical protein
MAETQLIIMHLNMSVAEMSTKFLVGKTEVKRRLGRPRHRWEDSIGMDLIETGCEGVDWISRRTVFHGNIYMLVAVQKPHASFVFLTMELHRYTQRILGLSNQEA